MDGHLLQDLSAISVLIPILVFLYKRREASYPHRLLFMLLILGLSVDLFSRLMIQLENVGLIVKARYFYSPTESVVFGYLLLKYFDPEGFRKKFRIVLLFFLSSWIIFVPGAYLMFGQANIGIYEMISCIALAFGSTLVLLEMVKRGEGVFYSPDFWICFGMFFYNISSFFIFSFLETRIGFYAYSIHSFTSIFTNMIYALGFSLMTRNS